MELGIVSAEFGVCRRCMFKHPQLKLVGKVAEIIRHTQTVGLFSVKVKIESNSSWCEMCKCQPIVELMGSTMCRRVYESRVHHCQCYGLSDHDYFECGNCAGGQRHIWTQVLDFASKLLIVVVSFIFCRMLTLVPDLWSLWNPLTLEEFRQAFQLISEKLKKNYPQLLPQWKLFHKTARPDHGEFIWKRCLEKLELYISEKIADGSQMSLSLPDQMKLQAFLAGLNPVFPLLQERSSAGVSMRNISTYFTTAPGAMGHADAGGDNTAPSASGSVENWEDDPLMFETFNQEIGKMPSCISTFRKGHRVKKNSVEEKGSPLRCKIILYDTSDLDSLQNWWKTKTQEMDVPYAPNSQMEVMLQTMFKQAWRDLKLKGASLQDIAKKPRFS